MVTIANYWLPQLMTGISWMLQEAGSCPPADYVVYDDHGEEGGSGDQVCQL